MANRDRDLMVDVGPAMRATIDRAVAAGITGRQWRVLGALLWWTASYSRLVDDVTHEQIAEHAGIDITTKSWRKTVARELRALAAAGVIVYVPGRGAGNASTVGVTPVDNTDKGGRGDPPWVLWRLGLLVSDQLLVGAAGVVGVLEFCWW
jgi:hypothetical protein